MFLANEPQHLSRLPETSNSWFWYETTVSCDIHNPSWFERFSWNNISNVSVCYSMYTLFYSLYVKILSKSTAFWETRGFSLFIGTNVLDKKNLIKGNSIEPDFEMYTFGENIYLCN